LESNNLSELELRIIRESRKKSLVEIAEQFNMSVADISKTLDQANRKISADFIRSVPSEELFLPRPMAFRLERKIGEKQTGTMKVGSQIVELLSKGIYSAPWNSMKELVSNSFDADAKNVEIRYIPKEKKLIVKDDGLGMNYEDFDEHFTFIVRSSKRDKGFFTTTFRRPIIGKIGIGFLAVSELCEQLRITSAKQGSDTYFIALIDFSKMRREEVKKKEFYEVSQFELTNYEKENIAQHYTEVEVLNLKKPFIDVLENRVPSDAKLRSVESTSFDKIVEELCTGRIKNIRSEVGPFWEFLINLANVIPVNYLDDGPLSFSKGIQISKERLDDYNKTLRIIAEMKDKLESYNFHVFFNGIELKKPIRFPNQAELTKYMRDFCIFPLKNAIQATDPLTGKTSEISYRGYFYNQRTRIVPEQLRGMVIRIKNVAVGGPIHDFWGHPYSGDSTYFPQTYGEVYFDEGLEDAMNIDRSTFKTSHHEFAATRDALHEFLRKEVFQTAKEMWSKRHSQKAAVMEEARLISRDKAVKQTLGKRFKTNMIRKFSPEPVQVSVPDQTLLINILSDAFQGFKKDDRLMLQDVAIALEIAILTEKEPNKIKEAFWRLLRELTGYRRS